MPTGIILFDERDFLRADPTLDLLRARDRFGRRTMQFVIYKLIYRITFRKAFDLLRFVLLDSLLQIPRHACVQRPRSVRQDVDCVRLHGIQSYLRQARPGRG